MYFPWENELPALAAMTDAEAAAAITAMTVTVRRPVPRQDIKRYIYSTGIWYKMTAAADNPEMPEAGRAVLKSGLAYLNDADFTTYDVDSADGAVMLKALVATGVVTQKELDVVLEMANVTEKKYPGGAWEGQVKTARQLAEAQQ